MSNIQIIGLKDIPMIKKGDDISQIIIKAVANNNLTIEDGDIFVIAQTIISKTNGRVRNLENISVSQEATEIFENILPKAKNLGISAKSPELIQLILDESKEIVKAEHVLITETNHGFICANAGIDKSNYEGKTIVGLLPQNPDEDALKIRQKIKRLTKRDIAVIISDSFGRPFRIGAVGVAIGVSGINPILDKRGSKDLFGYELQSTIIGHVDSLASAAQLIMGEADEGIPVVLIRGYKFNFDKNTSINSILRKGELDLFRSFNENQFLKILKNRRSYKLPFDAKKVNKKLIEDCIEVARWAPSAHNGQFWRYIIIEKGKMREKLINRMNLKLREDLEKDGKSDQFIKKKVEKTRLKFIEAPFLVLLCLDSKDLEYYQDPERSHNEYIMGIQSISCSAIYFLLALDSKKFASCWYCAPLFAKEIIKSDLNLPTSYIPMAFFTVGYPIKEVEAPRRKELKEIIFNL
jgi:coenzyme F420-0:L-glutamate ligase/coenzyme F420-1:gamma-L-glutamate ligase